MLNLANALSQWADVTVAFRSVSHESVDSSKYKVIAIEPEAGDVDRVQRRQRDTRPSPVSSYLLLPETLVFLPAASEFLRCRPREGMAPFRVIY